MSVDEVDLLERVRGCLVCIPVCLDSTTIKWNVTVSKVDLFTLLVGVRPLSLSKMESREVFAIRLCGECRIWLLDLSLSLDNLTGECWSRLCVLILLHQDGWWSNVDRGWSRIKTCKVV